MIRKGLMTALLSLPLLGVIPAEAQFLLAEYQLEDVTRLKIKSTNSKKMGEEAKKLFDALVKVEQLLGLFAHFF